MKIKIRGFYSFLVQLFIITGLCACTTDQDTANEQPSNIYAHTPNGTLSSDISQNGQWSLIATQSQTQNAVQSNKAVLIDLAKQNQTYIWRHSSKKQALILFTRISADNRYALTATATDFALWSIETGDNLGYWTIDPKHQTSIRDIALTTTPLTVLFAQANGQIGVLTVADNSTRFFTQHNASINVLKTSLNGKIAVSAGNDYQVLIWNTQTLELLQTYTHTNRITQVAISNDNQLIFSADKHQGMVWRVANRQKIAQLNVLDSETMPDVFTTAAFNHNASQLVTGAPNQALMLWQVNTGQLQQNWKVAPNKQASYLGAVVNSARFVQTPTAINEIIISESSVGNTEYFKPNLLNKRSNH